jgi:peptidoglycan/xylan/chitin deacetylase (PgdA/CDA1 family)
MDSIEPRQKNKPLAVFLTLLVILSSSILVYESVGYSTGGKNRPAVISISSDDGFASVYRIAFPIFKERGIPATVFVIATEIGFPGHFNLSQLTEMQDNGWEIGSHAMHHVKLTTLNETALSKEVVESKQLLMSHGFNVSSFAYPFSDINENVVKVVSNNYVVARLTAGPNDYIGYYPEIVKKEEFVVKAMSAVTDFQTIRRNIDTAIERHEWINFYFHGVEKDAKIDENLSWTLADMADYIKEKVDMGLLRTMTFIGAFEYFKNLVHFYGPFQTLSNINLLESVANPYSREAEFLPSPNRFSGVTS